MSPSPRETAEAAQIRAPTRGNRRLERLLAAVNADDQVKAWWHVQNVQAGRLGMSDHGWVHVQIVLNIALRLMRLLAKRGVEPAMVTDHAMAAADAEVVVAAACLLHDSGMSIHRTDHEAYSLFLAASKLGTLLEGIYEAGGVRPLRAFGVSKATARAPSSRSRSSRSAWKLRGNGNCSASSSNVTSSI